MPSRFTRLAITSSYTTKTESYTTKTDTTKTQIARQITLPRSETGIDFETLIEIPSGSSGLFVKFPSATFHKNVADFHASEHVWSTDQRPQPHSIEKSLSFSPSSSDNSGTIPCILSTLLV